MRKTVTGSHPPLPTQFALRLQVAASGNGKLFVLFKGDVIINARSPNKANPAYKGKWYAPMIDNPAYIGEWAPRKVPNPDFFEDSTPVKSLSKIVSHAHLSLVLTYSTMFVRVVLELNCGP